MGFSTVGSGVTPSGTATLTNKTIDGDNNTIQDVPETALKTAVGASGTVLTSTGVGAAPTFQAAAAGGSPTPAIAPDNTFDPSINSNVSGEWSVSGVMNFRPSDGHMVAWKNSTDANYISYTSGAVTRSASYTVVMAVRINSLSAKRRVSGMLNAAGASATSWANVHVETTGKLRAQFGDDTLFRTDETDNVVITANQMHIIAISYGAGDTANKIWVDSTLQATTNINGTAVAATGAAQVYSIGRTGAFASGSTEGWYGISWIWNSELTEAQVETASDLLKTHYGVT